MKTYSALPVLTFVVLFSFVPFVYAGAPTQPGPGNTVPTQPGPGNTGTTLINPLGSGTNLETFLLRILDLIIKIGTVVVVLMLVYVGYLFATSSIQPENKSKAKDSLLWTLVGALILLGSKAIAEGIKATVTALSG